MKILYYISPFGFGHLTRSLAVIEEILRVEPTAEFIIKAQPRHIEFAANYLKAHAAKISYCEFYSSFSIIFDQFSWAVDEAATRRDVLRWVSQLEKSARQEAAQAKADIALVISDIVPEAFVVAKELNVPGIALSNFTWHEICRAFCSEHELAKLHEQYMLATLQLEYDLSTAEQSPIAGREKAGLVCRPLAPERAAEIRAQYKKPGRPLLFLSIGGALELNGLNLPQTADFLCTQGIKTTAENAFRVPEDAIDTQNYLAACDGVITKCGWSTVSESLLAGKPLLLLQSSNGWVEEAAICDALKKEDGVLFFRPLPGARLPDDWLDRLIEHCGQAPAFCVVNAVQKVAGRLLEFARRN